MSGLAVIGRGTQVRMAAVAVLSAQDSAFDPEDDPADRPELADLEELFIFLEEQPRPGRHIDLAEADRRRAKADRFRCRHYR